MVKEIDEHVIYLKEREGIEIMHGLANKVS